MILFCPKNYLYFDQITHCVVERAPGNPAMVDIQMNGVGKNVRNHLLFSAGSPQGLQGLWVSVSSTTELLPPDPCMYMEREGTPYKPQL